VGEKVNAYMVLMGKTEGKRLFGRLGRGRRMILKSVLNKWDRGHRMN